MWTRLARLNQTRDSIHPFIHQTCFLPSRPLPSSPAFLCQPPSHHRAASSVIDGRGAGGGCAWSPFRYLSIESPEYIGKPMQPEHKHYTEKTSADIRAKAEETSLIGKASQSEWVRQHESITASRERSVCECICSGHPSKETFLGETLPSLAVFPSPLKLHKTETWQ